MENSSQEIEPGDTLIRAKQNYISYQISENSIPISEENQYQISEMIPIFSLPLKIRFLGLNIENEILSPIPSHMNGVENKQ